MRGQSPAYVEVRGETDTVSTSGCHGAGGATLTGEGAILIGLREQFTLEVWAISEPAAGMPQRKQASLTRKQFGDRAKAYASSALHSRDESLDMMERMARDHLGGGVARGNIVDVGCGAGFTAAAMSALASLVLATDLTPEMVEQAHRVGRERNATGMTAAIAAAAALPVRSGSVDLLTCRYAFHHMVDAERVLGEFRRVMTDDGSFLLADTVATEDPVVYEWMDKVERLRDPSHHLNRSPSELLALIEGCGFRVTDKGTSRVHLDLESWTQRSATPPAEVAQLQAMLAEAGANVVEAFEIVRGDRETRFSWPVLVIQAVRA